MPIAAPRPPLADAKRPIEPAAHRLDDDLLEFLLAEHQHLALPRLELLWDYYRNDLTDVSDGAASDGDRAYRLAQERGLPRRLRRHDIGAAGGRRASRHREVVIENDIAWRINALVDFMFGRAFMLQSLAPDPSRAAVIETFLRRVFDANGGVSFFHDLALLGSVYGHVDVLLRTDAVRALPASQRAAMAELSHHPGGPVSALSDADDDPHGAPSPAGATGVHRGDAGPSSSAHFLAAHRPGRQVSGNGAASSLTSHGAAPADSDAALAVAAAISRANQFILETIEAPRAIPVLNPADYRRLDAYVLHYRRVLNELDDGGLLAAVRDRVLGRRGHAGRRATLECVEVWSASQSEHRIGPAGGRRAAQRIVNRLGRIPVVHIQNLPQPFFYEGVSEVEPLIPLQDELNTRLSDRANRVTFQSFKMYLGKGIDRFLERPVGPGQMWATDNPAATIETFGGDASCPSEDAHIIEIREAMDKISAVSPLAAGVIRDRVGNLTSENALRVTMMGMLSRTRKKRTTYGAGVERICELILHAADVLGVLPNAPHERSVRIDWPSPIPESETDKLRDAKLKLELGVPRAQVLAELGYDECPA